MSDENEKVEVESTETEPMVAEQNIDNQEQKEEKTVPLRVLTEERKKLQARIAEAEKDAEIARKLVEASGKDRETLRREIELANQQRMKTQPQYQQPVQQNDELRKLREEFADDRRERELEKFAQTNILEIDSDMREDILNYAKVHDISVREATYARYGDTIINGMKKTSDKKARQESADMAMVSNLGSSDPFVTRTEVPLSPAEIKAAEKAGMSLSEWAAYSSNDPSVLRDYIKKQKK